MTDASGPERTLKDTVLVGVMWFGLSVGGLIRILDGPLGVASLLTVLAIIAGVWAAWRWYDREPDGRRGQ